MSRRLEGREGEGSLSAGAAGAELETESLFRQRTQSILRDVTSPHPPHAMGLLEDFINS